MAKLTKERYDEIMSETYNLEGIEPHKIKVALQDLGITATEDVKQFGRWFLQQGIEEGWLLQEHGF